MSFARRSLHSVTFCKPDKTYNGFTLFTPCTGEPSNTWLVDMQGRLVHRWKLPGVVRQEGVLLPTGNLLTAVAITKVPKNLPWWGGAEVLEIDWDGNIIWRYTDLYMNPHDRVRLKNGNTLIAKYVPVPKKIANKVKGGIPYNYEESASHLIPRVEQRDIMWGDKLQEITPDGKVVWEWVAHEHLDPELDNLHPNAVHFLWAAGNSLVELPDGNIMISCQYISQIYIIDKATGDIKWRWGRGIVSFQHNPSMLDNGNILLFDNGRWRSWTPQSSRVIEVNPSTRQIEWEYKTENPNDFFSALMGSCERLPNGNTLICEALRGRIFEVTASCELVWEYISPFYDWHRDPLVHGRNNYIFRAHRYGPDYEGLKGKKLNPETLQLWNQLYGPEAFGFGVGPSSLAEIQRTFIAPDEDLTDKNKDITKEASKPSVAKPQAKHNKKVSDRLRFLGY